MGAKIVIIDDDDAVRDSMHVLLDSYGYDVRQYASAEEFLQQATGKADCLLVDHHMPGMTGLDLLEVLRAKGDQTPALIVTGRIDPLTVSRAKAIGVKVVEKPVVEAELVCLIEEVRRAST